MVLNVDSWFWESVVYIKVWLDQSSHKNFVGKIYFKCVYFKIKVCLRKIGLQTLIALKASLPLQFFNDNCSRSNSDKYNL